MFIDTSFAVPVGRSFVACVRVASTEEEIDLPCAVVSSNVADDFSTRSLGMGVRFELLSGAAKAQLDDLLARGAEALCAEAEISEPDADAIS